MIIFDFKFSGHDTTSAAMTWTIQEIGNNQEVLKKCLAEIDEVFGDSDRPASIEDLNRLEVIIASRNTRTVTGATRSKYGEITFF